LLSIPAFGIDRLVSTQADYVEAVEASKPGDTILLSNGVWRDFEIVFTGKGTADKPITLAAESKGKVFISGRSNLRLAGEHLVVSGLVFKNGHSPRSPVIGFRYGRGNYANHTRVTEVVIDGFNKPERLSQDSWVTMAGKHNRIDHSYFAGKSNRGVTLDVALNDEQSLENHHRIDHNYFGPRSVLGANGGETLRIGNSWSSLSHSYTTVENNMFDRCDGEVEVISNKGGSNTFRGNLFFESRGTLTLRHGNNNLIENNVFLGNGVPHTGGIRVINKNQTIRNNYMYGLTGHRFGGGFVVMNGIYDSPINRYHQVDNALIENNSIIDVGFIELAAGSDEERSAPPINSVFQNNLVFNADGSNNIREHDDISGIEFTNNSMHEDVALVKAANGLFYPSDPALSTIGASRDLTVLEPAVTGPTWYAKPGNESRFSGGESYTVEPGVNTLGTAIASASPGDVLKLAPGAYISSEIIKVAVPVTLDGEGEAVISSERMTLFDIVEGGSLKLKSLVITAKNGPRSAGSSIIRTSPWSVTSNFELIVQSSRIENLDSGVGFNFFDAGKYTFADNIEITDSVFKDISGTVLKMNREDDDRGVYNAEYIHIADSKFENIGIAVADIYRCCTDESTFGPHFELLNSQIHSVGKSKNYSISASVRLLGAQVVTIDNNSFKDSMPIQVKETVGEPVTVISKNNFDETPEPKVISIVGQHESMYKL
jgi:poly(beta-D-mannuronate) lyase